MADHVFGYDDVDRHRLNSALVDGGLGMVNGFGILAGITLFIFIIALLDSLGRRKERRSRNRAA